MAEHVRHLLEGNTLPYHLGCDCVPEDMGAAVAGRQTCQTQETSGDFTNGIRSQRLVGCPIAPKDSTVAAQWAMAKVRHHSATDLIGQRQQPLTAGFASDDENLAGRPSEMLDLERSYFPRAQTQARQEQ